MIFAVLWISREIDFFMQIPIVRFLIMAIPIRAQIFKPNKSEEPRGVLWYILVQKSLQNGVICSKNRGVVCQKSENHIFSFIFA